MDNIQQRDLGRRKRKKTKGIKRSCWFGLLASDIYILMHGECRLSPYIDEQRRYVCLSEFIDLDCCLVGPRRYPEQ